MRASRNLGAWLRARFFGSAATRPLSRHGPGQAGDEEGSLAVKQLPGWLVAVGRSRSTARGTYALAHHGGAELQGCDIGRAGVPTSSHFRPHTAFFEFMDHAEANPIRASSVDCPSVVCSVASMARRAAP